MRILSFRGYFQVKTEQEIYWIKTNTQIKLTKGKKYNFYPLYLVEHNAYDKHLKKTFKYLYRSLDVVNEKYVDLSPYSFRGIQLGTHKNDVLRSLNALELPVVETETKGYEIDNYRLGQYKAVVNLNMDSHDKLYAITFEIRNGLHTSEDEAMSQLLFLTGVFEEKYGKASNCSKAETYGQILTENNYCEWSFGDTTLSTKMKFEEMKIIVTASIVSLSRAIQSYNTRVWRIALENDIPRRAKMLMLEEKRALERAGDEIKEGAKSF